MCNLQEIFSAFGFHINWKPGKTEAFICFRGKASVEHKREMFSKGDPKIPLNLSANTEFLRVVHEYKHLGSVLADDGNSAVDVTNRIRASISSYVPLATKVFGNTHICRHVRINLATSLVFSRLLYNMECWTKWTNLMYSRINAVYMRVLRRIAGMCRYNASCGANNSAVRRQLSAPSLKCIIVRRRLSLLRSVLIEGSPSLHSMLASVSDGSDSCKLPWVAQICADMRELQAFHAPKLVELGDPELYSDRWFEMIVSYGSWWKELVAKFSVCDCSEDAISSTRTRTHFDARNTQVSHAHVCDICQRKGLHVWFNTAKALGMHARAAHGVRNSLRVYLDASGQCPVCRVNFGSRTRCLVHISERRCRGKSQSTCRSVLESGRFQPLPQNIVTKLDDDDRLKRRHAASLGHSQPRAVVTAKRSRTRAVSDFSPSFPSRIDVGDDHVCRPRCRLRMKTALMSADLILVPCSKRQKNCP